MYHEAQASVRGPEGYGLPFPIEVGTREGGVESPHLYMIFVCNLIACLNAVALRDGGALLNGNGELVGINSGGTSEGELVSISIDIQEVNAMLDAVLRE